MKNAGVLLVALVFAQPLSVLHADGGTVRFSKQIGHYRITVFTSPIALRAGPVDVSVFIQDGATGEPVLHPRIIVRASPRDHSDASIVQQASTAAATNKLFQAAVFDLTQAGRWDVRISIEGLGEPIEVPLQMEVSEAASRTWALAAWISWPAAVVVLFCVHKWLVERKQRKSRRIKKAGSRRGEPALVTCRPIT